MPADDLFDSLDRDGDGRICREDLRRAARDQGWHWREAPLYAVLDALTLAAPLEREALTRLVAEIVRDPRGPYGRVLRNLRPRPLTGLAPAADPGEQPEQTAALLARLAGPEAANDLAALQTELAHARLDPGRAALLIIDPQRSFTEGAWMRSMGPDGARQVAPLRRAFDACAWRLQQLRGRVEIMFTRCPFPPDSYDWDPRVAAALGPDQPYFVKPQNSVLWPPTNGFAEWVEELLVRDRPTLVLGGCTLNSCVRVSAGQVQRRFAGSGLQVVVDLDLCGARLSNHLRSPQFGGRSSVEAAVREMLGAGVRVTPRAEWG
jgi:hypothetical protein